MSGEEDDSDLCDQDLLQTYKFKSALMLVPQINSQTATRAASLIQTRIIYDY